MDDKSVRKQKSGDQLAVGDWLAPGEILDGAAEVLHVLKYRPKQPDMGTDLDHVHLVVRELGMLAPYADVVAGNWLAELASDEDLAGYREAAERAQRIADIRAFADWLEANPELPVSSARMQVSPRHDGRLDGDVWNSGAEGMREFGRWAEIMGAPICELDDRTEAVKEFGRVEYRAIAWHKDGRPAEPAADPYAGVPVSELPEYREDDPTGLDYSRPADDPTPVSGARVEPHVGAVTDGGLVDESDGYGCPICDHDLGRHHDLAGCAVDGCECVESKASLA